MLDVNQKGALAEAKTIAWFVERGYNVFTQFSGKEPFDLVISKSGTLLRVQVKATSSNTVSLRTIASNRNRIKIKQFDNNICDLLAVYLIKEDAVVVLDSKSVENKSTMVVKQSMVVQSDLETETPC